MRAILVALVLALAGCHPEEPTLGGTVIRVVEAAQQPAEREESPRYYDPPLVPEVPWKVEVQLDNGSAVTLITRGLRRYEPGDRVRLLVGADGGLLL